MRVYSNHFTGIQKLVEYWLFSIWSMPIDRNCRLLYSLGHSRTWSRKSLRFL